MTRPFALSFTIRRGDLPRLSERLLNLSSSLPETFRVALYEEALLVLGKAQVYVPIKTGRLFRSGRAYWPSRRDPRINVQFLAPYALAVHERHKTRGKYLERAVNEQLPGMARRIARRIAELGP